MRLVKKTNKAHGRVTRRAVSFNKQSGYATILGAILMTAMALSIYSLYDVGQVTTHKMRGQNTADAGAYSVAAVVSRDLNFKATTNRAMVANQIAIGQLVGLSSYGHMIDQMATNISVVSQFLGWIPGLGQALVAVTRVLQQSAAIMKRAFDAAARTIIPINDAMIGALSATQHAFHYAMFAASQQVYNEVVRENDPDIDQSFVVGGMTVAGFINEYRQTLERNMYYRNGGGRTGRLHRKRFTEFEGVVLDSRDRFLRQRHGSFLLGTVRERGGNEFRRRRIGRDHYWEWTAMDTMRFRIRVCVIFCATIVNVPLGWGAAHSLNSGTFYNYRRHRSRWGRAWDNRNAANLARIDDGRNNFRRSRRPGRARSLRPFYDLEEDGLRERGPAMISVVKKPVNPVRVWKEVARDTQNYDLQERFDVAKDGGIANDQILSLGKAEPYFSRPADLWPRRDRQLEFGNMYNPFWQPRLAEASDSERSAVMLAAAGLRL